MKVIIKISELLYDIHSKSHLEVAQIADVETRYRTEAGTEKDNDIVRCLCTASSALYSYISRFLRVDFNPVADNNAVLQESFEYEFDFSERRTAGKAQALADAIHSYLVNSALSRFYADVAAGDLSTAHANAMIIDKDNIDRLLFTKRQPFSI